MFIRSDLLSIFFFSSRRRHTRWPRDWSSDVCSSDLNELIELGHTVLVVEHNMDVIKSADWVVDLGPEGGDGGGEIGRASCRERVGRWGRAGAVRVKKVKKKEKRAQAVSQEVDTAWMH